MGTIQKSIKTLLFHPGIILLSFACFLIILGLVGVKQSLAMLFNSQQVVAEAFKPSETLPTVTPVSSILSPIPTPTPTVMSEFIPTPIVTQIPTVIPTQAPVADATDNTVWESLAQCESNGHWSDNTGNGYFGGLQFTQGAWESVGGVGSPADASKDEQIMRGKLLEARRGWSPWSACSRKLGLN